MPSLDQHQLIASPADQTLPDAEPTSAPSDAELRGAPPPKEVEDAVLRWFPVFLGGWGLMILFLRYL